MAGLGELAMMRILDQLAEARFQLKRALALISEEQAEALRRLIPQLLDRTSSGSDLEELDDGHVLAEIARSIDPSGLQRVADLLAGLSDASLAAAVAAEFSAREAPATPQWLAAHVTGDILHAQLTPFGAIVIGGPGPNRYRGRIFYLIVDLAGDDRYEIESAGPVTAIIDRGGDDVYRSLNADRGGDAASEMVSGDHGPGPGGAVLGASIIVDHAGDDIYTGGMVTQGAAVAGVGLLYDLAGDDRYTADELAQGASLAGIGMLIDQAGDDVYTAAKFAQGYGGALGSGTLRDDNGNDRYVAGNKHPSGYGVKGRFQAFSQGVGMGFRNDIPGGTGLLHDRAGDDEYLAGNFAQGTGYYLGIGRLVDEAGNDRYTGSRYAQGAAAHLGIGLLDDRAGDDVYHGKVAATQAGAWDLALAAFIDRAGNDRYRANEFALAAAAQVAIAVFIDACGQDRYLFKQNAQGHSGPTDYHDASESIGNIAKFIDHPPPGNGVHAAIPKTPPPRRSGVHAAIHPARPPRPGGRADARLCRRGPS